MTSRNLKPSGFLLTELIVSLTVLAILMTGFALSLHAFAKFNRYQLVRQRCIAAAQAELDSITATGKAIPGEDFKRLWPRLTVSIEQSAGTGQWEGMTFLQVTAAGKSFRNKVRVQLSRYVSEHSVSPYTVSAEPFVKGQ